MQKRTRVGWFSGELSHYISFVQYSATSTKRCVLPAAAFSVHRLCVRQDLGTYPVLYSALKRDDITFEKSALQKHCRLRANDDLDLRQHFDHALPPSNAEKEYSWWTSAFGNRHFGVPWESFARKLEERNGGRALSGGVRLALDTMNEGLVTASAWSAYCSAAALSSVDVDEVIRSGANPCNLFLSKPWFAAFMTRQATDKYLSSCSPGDFLVRFGCSYPCTFVVAYVDDDGSVCQSLVRCVVGGYALDGGNGALYTSLTALIDANSDLLRRPAPMTSQVANGRGFFRGYISFAESEACSQANLQGRFWHVSVAQSPDGSYSRIRQPTTRGMM